MRLKTGILGILPGRLAMSSLQCASRNSGTIQTQEKQQHKHTKTPQ